MQEETLKHFENLKVGLTMALQRGVFGDFATATQIKISMDVVEQELKLHGMAKEIAPPPESNGVEKEKEKKIPSPK